MTGTTDPNTARIDRLLDSAWPVHVEELPDWLTDIDSAPPGITAPPTARAGTIEPSIHRGQLVGVHWFTGYTSDAELLDAHQALSRYVTERLGTPADEVIHPVYGASRLWRTTEFTIDTYAHTQRNDPPTGAVLQIHVDLTGPADERNAEAEKRERQRHELD